MIRIAGHGPSYSSYDPDERDAERPLSVAEVTHGAKRLLERHASDLLICGEISRWTRSDRGHLYLTIRDAASQLRVVIYRSVATKVAVDLPLGTEVVLRGSLTVYPPSGELQLQARSFRLLDERGYWQVELERIREALRAEGLLDPARKRSLPRYPTRIGLATSPQGAALQDIRAVLQRRFPAVELLLAATRVQGAGADAEIARAVRALSRQTVDLIIVARGGGSAEDLWAFNSESVARAIAEVQVAVISAVGHETDVTLADLVADVRAPTPSGAAELAVPDARAILRELAVQGRQNRSAVEHLLLAREADGQRALRALGRGLSSALHLDETRLAATRPEALGAHLTALLARREEPRIAASPERIGERLRTLLEQRESQLAAAAPAAIGQALMRLLGQVSTRLEVVGAAALREAVEQRVQAAEVQLGAARAEMEALSPRGVLARGWAMVRSAARQIVRHPDEVSPGESIHILVAGGTIQARVEMVTRTEEET